jgi:hypothetical protein
MEKKTKNTLLFRLISPLFNAYAQHFGLNFQGKAKHLPITTGREMCHASTSNQRIP